MNLKGKVVILTGHTGGIGKVVAEHLNKLGATVYGVSRSNGFDISDFGCVATLVNDVLFQQKKIDAIIVCSGIYGTINPIDKSNILVWKMAYDVNLFGPMYLTREVIPWMKEQREGKIIFLGGGGFEPLPNFSAYTSSKFALIKFAETIAEEVKDFNIQVNVISPGLIDTPLQNKVIEAGEVAGKLYETVKNGRESGSPTVAQPEHTAKLIEFLFYSNLTGKVLSALYDNYESFEEKYINDSDWYTVKRLDPFTIGKVIKDK